MYFLHSLQGQDVGFHCFIAFKFAQTLCFNSLRISVHIFNPLLLLTFYLKFEKNLHSSAKIYSLIYSN